MFSAKGVIPAADLNFRPVSEPFRKCYLCKQMRKEYYCNGQESISYSEFPTEGAVELEVILLPGLIVLDL